MLKSKKKRENKGNSNIHEIFRDAMILGNFPDAGVIHQDFVPPGKTRRPKKNLPPTQPKPASVSPSAPPSPAQRPPSPPQKPSGLSQKPPSPPQRPSGLPQKPPSPPQRTPQRPASPQVNQSGMPSSLLSFDNTSPAPAPAQNDGMPSSLLSFDNTSPAPTPAQNDGMPSSLLSFDNTSSAPAQNDEMPSSLLSFDNTSPAPAPAQNDGMPSSLLSFDNTSAPVQNDGMPSSLLSFDNTSPAPAPPQNDGMPSSLLSFDNTSPAPAPPQNDGMPSSLLSFDNTAPQPEPTPQARSLGGGLNIDFLKIPQGAQDASDLLNFNVSTQAQDEDMASSTMELDIRSTNLYKQKQAPQEREEVPVDEELLEQTNNFSLLESIFILRHALNFDFVENPDAKLILDRYYRDTEEGVSNETPASMLLRQGYVTPYQYQNLLSNLDKDRKAGRLARNIDISSQQKAELFLGLSEKKEIVSIKCPHCKSVYRIRISIKGGKLKCGKCKRYFFLRGK